MYTPAYPQYVEINETWRQLYSAWFLVDGIVEWVDRSMFDLFLHSSPVIPVDLLMLKFQANKQTPLIISPHPVRPSARSANFSTGHNPCIALMTVRQIIH
jgi:hypothetical protein